MKPRVVIVEDSQWLSEQYARLLAKAGFDVSTTQTARAAIDVIDDTQPVAIVLDMLLSGSTALPLLHELQSHDDLRHIPIIIVSGLGESITLTDLEPYGVRQLLDKTTMYPDDVVAAVKRAAK